MKTLTVILTDETAKKLADHAAQNGQSVEAWASKLVENAFDDDWGDLTPDQIAAIEEGLAEAERGETIPHEQVVAEFKAKYGW